MARLKVKLIYPLCRTTSNDTGNAIRYLTLEIDYAPLVSQTTKRCWNIINPVRSCNSSEGTLFPIPEISGRPKTFPQWYFHVRGVIFNVSIHLKHNVLCRKQETHFAFLEYIEIESNWLHCNWMFSFWDEISVALIVQNIFVHTRYELCVSGVGFYYLTSFRRTDRCNNSMCRFAFIQLYLPISVSPFCYKQWSSDHVM